MNDRFGVSCGAAVVAMVLAVSGPLFAQAPAAASKAAGWTQGRTPDGQPDIQGYWNNLSFTPLERPAKFAGREFLTEQEVQEVFKAGVQHSFEFTFANAAEVPVYDATTYALDAWQNGVKPNPRSSLIVEPADGRLPELTPEAKGRGRRGGRESFDGYEDLGLGVRCLSFGNGGPPMLPGQYNSNYNIVQGPGYVLIVYEWGSQTRLIPLEARPHLSTKIRPWQGDSRGHWEGNTLVVETTNFRPGATYQNANAETLKITERFTRLDADRLEYRFTMDDAKTWTRPWTAVVPLNRIEGPMFEYACHEGNNGAINILEGARAADQRGTAAPK